MQIIQDEIQNIQNIIPSKSSVAVIGYFDGFHRYHQKVLAKAQNLARKNNLKLVFVTFNQKIANFSQNDIQDLISNKTKKSYLEQNYHFDYYVELKVNQQLINTEKEFFLDWLAKSLGVKMLVEGQDFSFGVRSTGNIGDLIDYFGKDNVVIIGRHNSISSTKIRNLLEKGKVRRVNSLLKRNLELELVFLQKDAQQKWTINYPKVNLKPGVYQVIDSKNRIWALEISSEQNIHFLKNQGFPEFASGIHRFQLRKFLDQ